LSVIAGEVRRTGGRHDPVPGPWCDVLRRPPRLAYTGFDERQGSSSQRPGRSRITTTAVATTGASPAAR